MEDIDLEDVEEMEGAELVTSGEEESDADDLYETMVDVDMLGRDEAAKRKAKIDPGARKSKDVAKLLGALQTIRKADEMWARGVAVLEKIVGKYPDLASLTEVVKPAKYVLDKTPVSARPSQPLVPKEVPTVADLDAPKLYPSSHINTLGIRIFKYPVCESTF